MLITGVDRVYLEEAQENVDDRRAVERWKDRTFANMPLGNEGKCKERKRGLGHSLVSGTGSLGDGFQGV